MKHKLSVSLDNELAEKLVETLSNGKYRNKSHLVEFAVKKMLEDLKNGR
jgi:Arc/MetJ-type ribon-helix-helix transcriptional regulator